MKFERGNTWSARCVWLAAAVTVVACNTTSSSNPERLGQSQSPLLANPGFETGTPNAAPPAPWAVTTALDPNPGGVTVATPETRADLNLQTPGGTAKTVILATAAGPQTHTDAHLGMAASLRWPRYGNQCALVNQNGNNENVNSLTQTMTIGSGDVDPMDSKVHIRFVVAPVLENPGHPANEQPYYFVQVTNVTQGTTLFTDFNLSNQAGVPWKTITTNGPNGTSYDYTDWLLNDISPGGTAIAQGDHVKVEIIASGCSLGGHLGSIYVDGGLTNTIPGLFVVASGPAQANAGGTITYTLTYENGAAVPEAGTTITFTLPPGTTYNSINVPPGLTCTNPGVNNPGVVVCTVGTVPSGMGGSFTITVNVNPGDTGTVVAGNYWIQGTTSTALLGPKVITNLGCTADAQCPTGEWCEESMSSCVVKLPNGTLIPSDPGHNPTLGACSVAAGTAVCVSGVCSMANNECGYSTGEGSCTGNGAVLCQSMTCSTNGTCEPMGGCNVDADCSSGNWCDEGMHTCMSTLSNGTMIPNDPTHTNPMVAGMCATDTAMLVCTSKVCSIVNSECGYSNGEGPCTVATGPMLCQSGVCSNSGTCEPSMTCNVDADCSTGQWCDEGAHTCKPTLANGQMIPNDPTHTNPTLGGTCSTAAGTLVCTSKVCSMANQECGYSDGEGTCTVANGPMLCQSTACSMDGTCEPMGGCNVDGDCVQPGDPVCNPATHTCGPTDGTDGGTADGGTPDGGTPDGGAPDGGAHDGGVDGGAHDSGLTLDSGSAMDSAVAEDSGSSEGDAANDDTGVVEGGGCSIGTTGRSEGTSSAGALAGIAMFGIVAARRRRRAVVVVRD